MQKMYSNFQGGWVYHDGINGLEKSNYFVIVFYLPFFVSFWQ